MLAGMEPSQKFHEKREAMIERKYNVDEIQQRILNGDGGSWIKEPYDPDELCSTIERYTDGLIFTAQMNEIIETLSAAKAPKTDGKGNPYVDVLRGHVALLDAATTASRKVFRDAFIR